ncbi:hypothetical protein QL285_032347 [Trifolium repens]|nr:hypothetical protein QL285_032347 [Trifolium repens]
MPDSIWLCCPVHHGSALRSFPAAVALRSFPAAVHQPSVVFRRFSLVLMEVMGVVVLVLRVLMEASPGFDGGFSLRLTMRINTVWVLMFRLVLGVGPFGFRPSLPFGSVVPDVTSLCRWVGVFVFGFGGFCCSWRVSSGGGGGFGLILEVG